MIDDKIAEATQKVAIARPQDRGGEDAGLGDRRNAVLDDIVVLGPRSSRPANPFHTTLPDPDGLRLHRPTLQLVRSVPPGGVTDTEETEHEDSGVTDTEETEHEDKFENTGADGREVASKTSDIAGNGTTTATVLAQAIAGERGKLVAACMNPMDLKRTSTSTSPSEAIPDLERRSKKIKTFEEIVLTQLRSAALNGQHEDQQVLPDNSASLDARSRMPQAQRIWNLCRPQLCDQTVAPLLDPACIGR